MLGPFLIAARTRRHLSQKALAARVGITSSYLSDIERHSSIPSREVLQALNLALELPDNLLICMLYPADVAAAKEGLVCPPTA